MAPTSGSPVVRVYSVRNAPTGESIRYVTADGRVWKSSIGLSNVEATGEQSGYLVGGEVWTR